MDHPKDLLPTSLECSDGARQLCSPMALGGKIGILLYPGLPLALSTTPPLTSFTLPQGSLHPSTQGIALQ